MGSGHAKFGVKYTFSNFKVGVGYQFSFYLTQWVVCTNYSHCRFSIVTIVAIVCVCHPMSVYHVGELGNHAKRG